ncbi:DUF4190 domain-containing protein [Micromonospora radicis]|uniref:DUF4190 domain-containing protein n=1 Tax=Micromonospora radicis TaxID=1894971 RepID=A0A418MMZ2_9ACTN|nr:DUF4190 domain-containing protein [Micromonospora radicis]RIV30870.1 DUF4190 domain-containing protein [Micromonospora radicis]
MTQPPPGGWPDPSSSGQSATPPADPTLPVSPHAPPPAQPTGHDPYQPVDPYQPAAPYQPADPYQPVDPYAGAKSAPSVAPYPAAGYPPPPPGYGYPPPGYGHPQPQTNPLAIAALVLSLIGIVSCITAPIGAIMGHVASRQIRERGEGGEGMAKAAIIVGWVFTGLLVLVILGYVALIAFAITTSSTV